MNIKKEPGCPVHTKSDVKKKKEPGCKNEKPMKHDPGYTPVHDLSVVHDPGYTLAHDISDDGDVDVDDPEKIIQTEPDVSTMSMSQNRQWKYGIIVHQNLYM